MKVVYGDLIQLALAGQFDVIIHGCNCFCTMGAGIAKAIRREFPEAYAADQATIKGERQNLGTMSTATVERHGQQLTIVNGYTQYRYGGSGRLADYEAIRAVMRSVKAQFGDKRIGYPRIGAGLARGEWPIIAQIIDEELAGTDHTLVEYQTQ
ncbi:MAG: macro domain-containing protein [Anaerolineales bacterium]|nr:macro domain-containing protein [Anaerolineales bacterium]